MNEFNTIECDARRLHLTAKGFEDSQGNVFNHFKAKLVGVVALRSTNEIVLEFCQYDNSFNLSIDSETREGRYIPSIFCTVNKPIDREYSLYATTSSLYVAVVYDGEERILPGCAGPASFNSQGRLVFESAEEPQYESLEDAVEDDSDPSLYL